MTESMDLSSFEDYCSYHDRIEPFRQEVDHIACTECGHVYRTKDELRKEYYRRIQVGIFWSILLWPFRSKKFRNLEFEILACPLCGHDF